MSLQRLGSCGPLKGHIRNMVGILLQIYPTLTEARRHRQDRSERGRLFGPLKCHTNGIDKLHFSKPSVYHEIYNAGNRWAKEPALYHSFGEDRSSFGFLDYKDAKPRKDILQPIFSRKAVMDVEGLIQEKVSMDGCLRQLNLRKQVDRLCESFVRQGDNSVNLFFAFRCMSIDVITCNAVLLNTATIDDCRHLLWKLH
jgi:hypothetical protein